MLCISPRHSLTLALSLWLVGIVAGFSVLESYEATPGSIGEPSEVASAATGNASLVLFIHPRCPCSTASLAELAVIVERQPHVTFEVVFVLPEGVPAGWEKTHLWRAAEALPGVRVRADQAGVLARQAGSQTSGHVVLRGPDGKLLYSGGITRSRGHQGDNAGLQAVLALLEGGDGASRSAPVFGCPLFSPNSPNDCCKKEVPSCP